MVQKLSLISVLTLVLLAGAGSVVVATRSMTAGASLPPGAGFLTALPAPSSGQGGGPSGTSGVSDQTVTTTVTQTNSTSTSATAQTTAAPSNSTSAAAGSLLVAGNPASAQGYHSGGDDGGMDGRGSDGGSG